jgi:hypothetical protein
MENADSDKLPSHGTVEQLLKTVEDIPAETSSVGIWIPAELTLNGHPISQDNGMALVLEALLAKDFAPRESDTTKEKRFHIFDR